MHTPPPVLEVDVAYLEGACVIRIRGELDIAGCPTVERELEAAERSGPERLIIDLEQLEFIDARGLRVLVEAARRSAQNGNRLQIMRGSGQVPRLIQLAEAEALLPLAETAAVPRSRTLLASSE